MVIYYNTHILYLFIYIFSYYEVPPGFQFLHCIKNEASGGGNVFVDAIKGALLLKETKPLSFKLLSSVYTSYHKQGKDHSLAYRRPVIQLNDQNEVIAINYSPPFLGTLAIPYDIVQDYYNAWNDFTKVQTHIYIVTKLNIKRY